MYHYICTLCSTEDNLHRQAIEFCENQKDHNIIYSEVRLCPFLYTPRGLTPEGALKAVLQGLREGEKLHNVTVRVIICFIKPCPGNYIL